MWSCMAASVEIILAHVTSHARSNADCQAWHLTFFRHRLRRSPCHLCSSDVKRVSVGEQPVVVHSGGGPLICGQSLHTTVSSHDNIQQQERGAQRESQETNRIVRHSQGRRRLSRLACCTHDLSDLEGWQRLPWPASSTKQPLHQTRT